MIQLTVSASNEIKRLMAQEQQPSAVLRVGVKGGGCSGLSYVMGFDAQAGAQDHTFDCDGIKVVVDPKSHLYIDGITIDYVAGIGGGFKFDNPNAKKSCGCGTSFTA